MLNYGRNSSFISIEDNKYYIDFNNENFNRKAGTTVKTIRRIDVGVNIYYIYYRFHY